jgi:hypothetical protein
MFIFIFQKCIQEGGSKFHSPLKGWVKRNSVPKGGKDEIHKVIFLVDMHVSQLYILYTNKYMKKKTL